MPSLRIYNPRSANGAKWYRKYSRLKTPIQPPSFQHWFRFGSLCEPSRSTAIENGNYVPGIRWTLENGVLTVMPEKGYSWGVGIKDGVTASGSDLADWVTLSSAEWKTVTEIDFECSVAFGDSKGKRYCPRVYGTRAKSTLVKADLSGWDTSKVTDMSFMFRHCESLTALDVSNFDTSKVTNMSCMFDGC